MFNRFPIVLAIALAAAVNAVAGEVLPDPTRPLEYARPAVAASALKLSSILIGKDRKLAVINGVALTENQWIGDKRILRIDKNCVTLAQDGRQIVLTLHSAKVRQ